MKLVLKQSGIELSIGAIVANPDDPIVINCSYSYSNKEDAESILELDAYTWTEIMVGEGN